MNMQAQLNSAGHTRYAPPSRQARLGALVSRTVERDPTTLWAFLSLISLILAFTSFNFGPILAPKTEAYLHAAHREGHHLFSLQQHYVRLQRDLSTLRDQKSLQDAKITLLEDDRAQLLSRLARLEIEAPRQIAVISGNNDPLVTGSVDNIQAQTDTSQPQLKIYSRPLVTPHTIDPPLTDDDPGTGTMDENTFTNQMPSNSVQETSDGTSDTEQPAAAIQAPFAIDLGVYESEAAARTYWTRLSSRIGTAFLGLSAQVVDAELDGLVTAKKLVIGPLETISESLLLCAQLETHNVKCEIGLFEGKEL